MVKHFAVWSCVGLLLTTPAIGVAQQPQAKPPAPPAPQAKPQDTVLNQVTLKGTVTAVDQTARTVTVRGSQGNIVTLDVPTSVTRLDQVKVGDTITVTYSDRIGVRLHPAGAPGGRSRPDDHDDDSARCGTGCILRPRAGDDRHRHRVGPLDASGQLHHANGSELHPSIGRLAQSNGGRWSQSRPASRRHSCRGLVGHDAIRDNDNTGSGRSRSGPRQHVRQTVHDFVPVRPGQFVQWKCDPGGNRPDTARRAH